MKSTSVSHYDLRAYIIILGTCHIVRHNMPKHSYYLANKINGDSTERLAPPNVTKHDTTWNTGI
jgi:hypothetical protein